ncbi:hypothetical protein BGW36DRAFT_351841 [Talaromyces proteolyticus]|uniref:Rhodopsin domain-containing protein n=1 Tax=Talaromyces proteolyticus TaxID=1131652 RepID=A0AAD4KHF5_9EURO|nr:uncharacterized protein BGW36DRAFT_351841 [Talaromyces proteolyticus]KAH8689499.1 hypothetical protein BGW36DRAFT_351841 [Talaromyces proteolyticus]
MAGPGRGPTIIIVNATIQAVATIFVLLRLISKVIILKRRPSSDDWTIIAATIFAILNIVVAGLGVKYGTGKHIGQLEKSDALPAAKLRWVTHIIYTVISGLIKVSTLLLYKHVFLNLRNVIWGTIVFIAVMSVAIVLATLFQCQPIDAVYDSSKYAHYYCFPSIPFWYSTAALSLVTDFWILALPIPTIIGLQMSRRSKIILIGILSLGAFACVASIVRMVYIVKLYRSKDPTWDTYGVSIWSGVELAVAIIANCIPGIKPAVDVIAPRFLRSSRGGTYANHYDQSKGARSSGQNNTNGRNNSNHQQGRSIPLSSISGIDEENVDNTDNDSTKTITRAYANEVTVGSGSDSNSSDRNGNHHPANGISVQYNISTSSEAVHYRQ